MAGRSDFRGDDLGDMRGRQQNHRSAHKRTAILIAKMETHPLRPVSKLVTLTFPPLMQSHQSPWFFSSYR
jgi:hypothetical protein